MHACERWACESARPVEAARTADTLLAGIPVVLAFVLLAGFGARHLGSATSYNAGAGMGTAGNVLSWAGIVVGFSRECD